MGKRKKHKKRSYYNDYYNYDNYNYVSWCSQSASHKDIDAIAIKVFGSLLSSNFKTSHSDPA